MRSLSNRVKTIFPPMFPICPDASRPVEPSKKSNAISGKPSSYTLRGCGKMANRSPSRIRRSPTSNCKDSVDALLRLEDRIASEADHYSVGPADAKLEVLERRLETRLDGQPDHAGVWRALTLSR